MGDKWEEVVAEVEFSSIFYYILKFWHTFWHFDLDPWKFIIGLRYNPNSTCLSILHFFPTSQYVKEKILNRIFVESNDMKVKNTLFMPIINIPAQQK